MLDPHYYHAGMFRCACTLLRTLTHSIAQGREHTHTSFHQHKNPFTRACTRHHVSTHARTHTHTHHISHGFMKTQHINHRQGGALGGISLGCVFSRARRSFNLKLYTREMQYMDVVPLLLRHTATTTTTHAAFLCAHFVQLMLLFLCGK